MGCKKVVLFFFFCREGGEGTIERLFVAEGESLYTRAKEQKGNEKNRPMTFSTMAVSDKRPNDNAADGQWAMARFDPKKKKQRRARIE